MKNIKTKLASLLLLFSLGFFSSSFYNSPLSEAGSFCEGLLKGDLTNDGGVEDFCDGAEDSGGSSTLSFSQYQLDGDLGELSTEGLSTSLTSAGGNLKDFILTIVDFALGFLGLIAVLIVIYGGVLYVTAGGETERTDKGKKAIMYATVGLLIVLGSFAFVNTVIQGGTGGEENGAGGGATGSGGARRNSTSFNAAAVQVQAIGQKIFDEFEFLADVTEELKSIKADAEKPSLDPQNFPPKGEILSYLSSVKGKLQRIESQLATFSEAEAVVKDLIRDIDYEMDRINVLTDQKYINRNDWTDMCDPTGKEDESDCREKENFEPYIVGLAERWEEIRNVYFLNEEKATDTDYDRLTPILEPIANDYKRRLIGADETFNVLDSSPGYIGQLVEIWDFVSVVDAVGIGEGAASFRNMMAEFGYDYQATTDTFDTNDSPNSLVWNVDNWLIDIDVSTGAG